MHKSVFLPVLLMSTLLSTTAYAYNDGQPCCRDAPKWYVGLSTALVFLDDTTFSHPGIGPATDSQTHKPGYNFSGQLGYNITNSIRSELEVAYRSNDLDSDPGAVVAGTGKAAPQTSTAIMANGYYDFVNRTNYTPYIGAGIGMADVITSRYYSISGSQTEKLSGWTPAYQFMAGLGYRFYTGFRPIDTYIGYRYFTGQDAEKKLAQAPGVTYSFPNDSHNIELGARLHF